VLLGRLRNVANGHRDGWVESIFNEVEPPHRYTSVLTMPAHRKLAACDTMSAWATSSALHRFGDCCRECDADKRPRSRSS
jgi:hypothetical protein